MIQHHPLQVGERVRIVRLPTVWKTAQYKVSRTMRDVYRRLIARRRPVRIDEIDMRGLPWIRCQFKDRSGQMEYHFLVLDDGSWVRVVPRKSARS